MSTHILSGWTEYPKAYFPKTKSLSGFNSDRINYTNELSPPGRNKQVNRNLRLFTFFWGGGGTVNFKHNYIRQQKI
jgi:hypothetical protein